MMRITNQYVLEIRRRHITADLEQTGVALTMTLQSRNGESIILMAAAKEDDAVFHIEVFGAGDAVPYKMGPMNWNITSFQNTLEEAVASYIRLGEEEKGFLPDASFS